jgi:hypothetical protein
MLERRFPVPRDAEVIQVKGKGFSRQSLTGVSKYGSPLSSARTAAAERLRDEVLALLRMLSGEVLLVTYKAVEELLQSLLSSGNRVAHFGALRGLNTYQAYETVVVLGRQQPSAQTVEVLARPFAADDDEPLLTVGGYVQQCRAWRLRDRSPSIEVVQVHPDPTLPGAPRAGPRGRDRPGDRSRAAGVQPPPGHRVDQPGARPDRRSRGDMGRAAARQTCLRVRATWRPAAQRRRSLPWIP